MRCIDRVRRYCLYCFASLRECTNRCDSCARVTPPSLRREFWSLKREHVRAERWLKAGISMLAIVGVASVLGPAAGPRAGYLFALPLCVAVALCKTASKLTRHAPYFQPGLVWTISLGLLASALLLAGEIVWAGLAGCLIAIEVWACRCAEDWKRGLIAGGADIGSDRPRRFPPAVNVDERGPRG